jgi:anti-sigma factor RsiW
MKCGYSEKDIALFVEGDLPALRFREVEAHLNDCETCGELAEGLRESQAMLRGLRQEMVSSAALTGVRERVLAQVGSMESPATWMRKLERLIYVGFRPRYALTGVVLAAMVSAGIWYSLRPAKAPEMVRSVVGPAPVLNDVPRPAQVVPARTVRKTTKAQRYKEVEVQPKAAEAPRQVAIKLFTDDPNIVIYWLVDQKGEDE